jgi:hypothetical protein
MTWEGPSHGLYPWWLLDTVILFLSFRHFEVPGHGLLDTVIRFLSFRHVEVPGHGLLDTVILFLSLGRKQDDRF